MSPTDPVAQLRADLEREKRARLEDTAALFEEIRVLRRNAGFDSPSHLAALAARNTRLRPVQAGDAEPLGDAYSLDRARRDVAGEAAS